MYVVGLSYFMVYIIEDRTHNIVVLIHISPRAPHNCQLTDVITIIIYIYTYIIYVYMTTIVSTSLNCFIILL